MTRILLLIPTTSYRAEDFLDAARDFGVDVVVGSDQRHVLEHIAPGRSLWVNMQDPEQGALEAEAFAREYPFDAVVPVDDVGTLLAARAAARLGLPHNPFEAVEATRDKSLLRQRLEAGGLPSPPYLVLPLDSDPAEGASRAPYPCVLKPLGLAASRGVIRANNEAEFAAAFERIRRLLTDPAVAADCGPTADRLLVEGFVAGVEVAVEGLLTDGRLITLAIFDKPDPLDGPYFEETIYVTPSRLSEAQQQSVIEATARSAQALGLVDGPIHAELRVNEDGAWPIDVAARSIGGLCARTLSFGTGMSLEEIILRHATRSSVPTFDRESTAAGVMMLPIPAAGTLRKIEGIEQAEAVTGIESVTMSMRLGDRVVPLPEGGDYLGFMFARADTPAEVEQALRDAHALLHFTIE
ncbi:MAG: ATP-grasp domain-containing protein [Dehalococcoidia bacterium]|nr:ATP-grasp domain-containing protein [Dehalococcoidia bacterium]